MTEIRFVEPDELRDYRDAIGFGFGFDPTDSTDEDVEHFEAVNPLETSIAAFDRGHIVATFGSYDLDLTLPGGATVPLAGTTHVTVHPTHRRRGILTEMMRLHLDQAVERGQPLAGLWASEERIYGRFGYGPATFGQELSIRDYTVDGPAPDPAISVHPLTPEEASSILPGLYERRRPEVAGYLVRPDSWWEHRYFPDPPTRARGASRQRYVVAERDGEPIGYLSFRLRPLAPWEEGRTQVVELLATDDDARRALWHFATNVDLYRNVAWWNAPMDAPTLIEVDRFRQVGRRVMDALWLRPLDVPSLLEARTYERDGLVEIGIEDRFGPAGGRYRLEVVDGKGRCERLAGDADTGEADVTMAVEELGRLLLGGVSAVTLRQAGLIAGDGPAVDRLDDLVTTRTAPHCPEVF